MSKYTVTFDDYAPKTVESNMVSRTGDFIVFHNGDEEVDIVAMFNHSYVVMIEKIGDEA